MSIPKVSLFMPLILLLLTSGCTMLTIPFESQTPVGAGVVIESFGIEPEMSEVYSNEEVLFVLKFRNTGTAKAENCFAELLGLDQTWKPGEGARTNPRNQEVFPMERECQYDQRNHWIVLLPPDPTSGIEGAYHVCTWKYRAPEVPPGLYADYKPRARVFYDYESFIIKTITIVPRDELTIIQNQGKPLPAETVSKSKSPISIDVETRSPIRTHGETLVFPVIIKVENVGGGTVCENSEKCRKFAQGGPAWNRFTLNINLPPGMEFVEESCSPKETISLVGGKSQTIACKVRVTEIPDRLTQKNLEIRAKYGYFIDKTIEIRVLPSG